MNEFSYGGGKLPKDEGIQREHQRDVREEAERSHQADEAAKAEPTRPWWRFWGKRSS